MSDAVGTRAIPPVISFDDPLPEPVRYAPPAERILAGNPQQTGYVLFESADKRFCSGIWECEPGKWRVVFSESEFCQLLAGTIIVSGDDGAVRTFKAGDAFVSPAGFTGTWEVVERAKKYYVFYE